MNKPGEKRSQYPNKMELVQGTLETLILQVSDHGRRQQMAEAIDAIMPGELGSCEP